MVMEPADIAKFVQRDDFYRLLVQNLPKMALIVFDTHLRYVLAEGAYLETAGYSSSDLLGKTLEEVLPPSRYAALLPHYQAALSGAMVVFEGTSAHTFYRSRISPVRGDQGEVIAGMIVTEDITDQKRAEQTLQDSEARYRSLAENSSDLILQVTPDGEYSYVSPSSQRILGYTPTEMLGKTILDFAHPDEAQHVRLLRLTAVEHATALEPITVRFRHKQGHYLWLERTGLPVFSDASHALIGFVLTCRDVTERHLAEASLRESEERLRLFIETSLDGIILGDKAKTGKILMANPAACRMFTRTQAELLDCRVSDLFDATDPRFMVFSEQRKLLSAAQAELTGVRKDGTRFPVDVTVSDFTNRDGQVLAWRILRDMSDRQRYLHLRVEQEKLITALQKETELSHLKSRMMERVAHEFRTPLATIGVSLTLLTTYSDRLSAEQKLQKSQVIRQQTSRLTDMLDEINLAISDNLVPEKLQNAPIDLKSLSQHVALELEEQFARPGVFVFDLPATSTINGDYTVIKTAILHVMRNALRFSDPNSQVNVTLSTHVQGAELRIIDSGLGIPPKDQPRIFEPFYRGLNIGEISGLGLGLTIAQASIAAHNGTIKLDSVLGQGTTVTISLPHSPF